MALNCPACKRAMVPEQIGPQEIDICKLGCRGIWFDDREITRLDTSIWSLTEAIEAALEAPPRMRGYEILKCPRCAVPMQLQAYKRTDVFVDLCYRCGGFFLDAGELKEIRDALDARAAAQAEEAAKRNQRLPPVLSPAKPLRKLTRAEREARGYLSDGRHRGLMTWPQLISAIIRYNHRDHYYNREDDDDVNNNS